MSSDTDSNRLNDLKQLTARPAVTGTQFQLPRFIAEEIAFKSDRLVVKSGALVAWYYHKEKDKAVLSNGDLDHPALDYVASCSLSGVSNSAVETGSITSGKVTISADLPDPLYQRLVAAEKVVLRVASYHQCADQVRVFASVYPAAAYDRGEPVDVTCEPVYSQGEDGSMSGQRVMGMETHHVNSI